MAGIRERVRKAGRRGPRLLGAFAPISRILRRISPSSWLLVELDDTVECRGWLVE